MRTRSVRPPAPVAAREDSARKAEMDVALAGVAIAVVCPGHGGEHGEMRAQVAAQRPDLLAAAHELLGCDPFEHLADGTAYVQPAVYCASLAASDADGSAIEPVAVSGHSLGEVAALVIGGALSAEDGLRVAVARGRACQAVADAQVGGMLILKANAARAGELALRYGLEVTGENAPMQTALSGPTEAIRALERDARELRVPVKRLGTAIPFHTEAMRDAAAALGDALASVEVLPPRVPVISAMTAQPFSDVRAELALALMRPVRWRATTLALRQLGAERFVETGPGRVLSRLVGQTLGDPGVARSLDGATAASAPRRDAASAQAPDIARRGYSSDLRGCSSVG